ncbi:MAG: AMP-binding protein [Candidatus Kapaibacterium sp.]
MHLDFLIERFRACSEKEAFVRNDESYNYREFLSLYSGWRDFIIKESIEPGSVVAIESSTTPAAIALLLALIDNSCICIPFTPGLLPKKEEYFDIALAEYSIKLNYETELIKTGVNARHELYKILRNSGSPGLVLFSSGTAGKSKAAVHDMGKLLKKYHKSGKDFRTLVFMQFDHIGGVDTLFYSMSNASTIITTDDRSPETVCRMVEMHKVEVLPVTPTFINLLIISEAYKNYDLSSLKYITYGTEVMPEFTLKKCNEIFPDAKLLQKYGTTETGTLRSKSESSGSTWVKIGGEGFDTKIVDGILYIKADSAMLGYLNHESPFTDDGWVITGDEVEQKGDYIRFKGRKTEIINVGGEKVYPVEVENVIHQYENVVEVTIFSEKNSIMGNIVCANVRLKNKPENERKEAANIKKFCRERLETYKVPVKINFVHEEQYSDRYKKKRHAK